MKASLRFPRLPLSEKQIDSLALEYNLNIPHELLTDQELLHAYENFFVGNSLDIQSRVIGMEFRAVPVRAKVKLTLIINLNAT
jgi:hypothetical protein